MVKLVFTASKLRYNCKIDHFKQKLKQVRQAEEAAVSSIFPWLMSSSRLTHEEQSHFIISAKCLHGALTQTKQLLWLIFHLDVYFSCTGLGKSKGGGTKNLLTPHKWSLMQNVYILKIKNCDIFSYVTRFCQTYSYCTCTV